MSTDLTALAAIQEQIALALDPVAAARAQLAKPVPIEEWVAHYRAFIMRPAWTDSAESRPAYNSTLDHFTAWVQKHDHIVGKTMVAEFVYSRCGKGDDGEPNANTWNRHLTVVRRLFNHLVDNQLEMEHYCPTIYRDQVYSIPRMPKPLSKPHPLAVPDALAILNGDDGIDTLGWLGFCYTAGLRRFEVSLLEIGQIDVTGPYRDRWVRDIRRKGKGERMRGDVPYGLMGCLIAKYFPDTVGRHVGPWFEAIERIVASRGPDPTRRFCVKADDYGKDQHYWVNKEFLKLRTKYELPYYKPHDLRDSCSTNLGKIEGLSPDLRMKWMAHVEKATNDLYTEFDDNDAKRLL